MTVRIKSGIVTWNDGRRRRKATPKDGPVTATPKAEARWVERGIAEYVDAQHAVPVHGAYAAQQPTDDAEMTELYEAMSAADLKAECDRRGIPYRAKATKAELVELLEEADAEDADEEPPAFDALGAE